jgi:hypothetical protein
MGRYVDEAGMFDFVLEARYASLPDLGAIWDATDDDERSGRWVEAAIEWTTQVEDIAVTEFNADRWSRPRCFARGRPKHWWDRGDARRLNTHGTMERSLADGPDQ